MRILFISHRIPYPPDKGDKIRSYNILRHLAQKHDVYLACMIDNPKDRRHVPVLSSMVKGFCCDTVHPLWGKLLAGAAYLRSKPLSAHYFYSRKIQDWIDNLFDASGVDAVFCSSSPTAEYLFRSRHYGRKSPRLPRVMDFIDVDSCKWEQYAERTRGVMRAVYGLEAEFLRQYEARIAGEFDRVLLVSEAEKQLFLDRVPSASSPDVVTNGVDFDYFTPATEPRFPRNGPVLAFAGAMDYYPNVDGARWFVQNVHPRVRRVFPDATFYIVGSHPTPAVRRLEEQPGVRVTGYVEDIRTYLADADVCVIPLHIARGIQNKVLEAMAMGKALVCTPQALEGIDAAPGRDLLTASDPDSFADAVAGLLGDSTRTGELGTSARAFVETHFSWEKNLSLLDGIFE